MKKLLTGIATLGLAAMLVMPTYAKPDKANGPKTEVLMGNHEEQQGQTDETPKGPDGKVNICHHTEGVNEYILINVSENARTSHLAHGDYLAGEVGESVPFLEEGYYFTDSCEYEFVRSALITSPDANGEYHVGDEVTFAATLWDEDGDDNVQWAVRRGTCAAGTNTVYGNVDGYHDDYDWDYMHFSSTADTTEWEAGDYCFIFNPTETAGDTPIRLTRNFTLLEALCDVYTIEVDSVNGNSRYWHDYEITFCPDEDPTGEWLDGAAGSETVYDISLTGDDLAFTAEYDSNAYKWYPEFTLESDNNLTFIDGHGVDNVTAATGTWSIKQE